MKVARRRIERLVQQAAHSPFYREKLERLAGGDETALARFGRLPPTTQEELEAAKIRLGDPLSGRTAANRAAQVVFQLESDGETALYVGLDRADLNRYARVLAQCWSVLPLGEGERVAIFDYGTSPMAYLASSMYTPYLGRGAAEAHGCIAVCNDGIASMAARAVDLVRHLRPRALFVRDDCLHPFLQEAGRRLPHLKELLGSLVVSANEAVASRRECREIEARLGIPVLRLLRIDAAMYLAMECPECRQFHSGGDYLVETLPHPPPSATATAAAAAGREGGGGDGGGSRGRLMVTNLFAKACPTLRYLSQLEGSLLPAGCPRAPRDARIAL